MEVRKADPKRSLPKSLLTGPLLKADPKGSIPKSLVCGVGFKLRSAVRARLAVPLGIVDHGQEVLTTLRIPKTSSGLITHRRVRRNRHVTVCVTVFPVLLCLKQNPFSGHFSGGDSYFYLYNPIRSDDMLSGKLSATAKFTSCNAPTTWNSCGIP